MFKAVQSDIISNENKKSIENLKYDFDYIYTKLTKQNIDVENINIKLKIFN